MRQISIVFLVFFVLTLVFFPLDLATAKTNDKSDLHVLIQYRAASRRCTVTTNDQVKNFSWGGWKLPSGITDYRVNFSTLPSSISKQTAEAAFDWAFSTIQGAGGGILFHYAGSSTESRPSNNQQNTIMWRTMSSSIVAVTYIWTDNGRLIDADTVFNKRYKWSYSGYNGNNDCSGLAASFDLRNIATHEFGHWVGLGDLYDPASKDLTMYGYASRGELKKDNLGVGDIIGVRAVWP